MFSLGTVLTVIVLVVGVVAALNWRAFSRILSASKAQVGKFGRTIANADPMANYQERIDDATDNLRAAKEGLIRCRSLATSVERQVQDGEQKVARYDALIRNTINSDKERAAEYVRQLQDEKRQLDINKKQLAAHKETYDSFLKQVQFAQTKIVSARKEAESLGMELQMSKAAAELAQIAEDCGVDMKALDGLSADREAVRRQIDENRARSQVSRDLNSAKMKEMEDEAKVQEQEVDALLAQYQSEVNKV